MSNITIKEIADLAGVSVATVSRVLNGNGRYSDETKQRVLGIAEKFNYRTNVVAKSLRTNQSKTIGVIVPDITNEFFAKIALAIEHVLVPYGYSIFICNTSEDHEKEKRFVRDLESKGVDGLIYVSGNMNIPDEATIKRLPIVCINRRDPQNQEFVVVESDNYNGGFVATEELIAQGCKHIVIVKDERDIVPMNERYRGYREALKKHGILLDLDLVIEIPVDVHHAEKAMQHLLGRGVKFDGIFACTDWLAIGALKALQQNHIHVPQEVQVIGFDNILVGEHSHPTLTTIHQDKIKLGEVASEILLNRIEHRNTLTERKIVVPVSLIKRNTTLQR
ncbi:MULTISPECIES: LacI family DNA-binding transcriptional regulator [unclassified Paenibacillus]|uniref:LacI family DNA-binding transcriptional regulator n=1 Tax=unclassified Paenibacillus TaxID=185978 RepID=UPI001AE553F9|nr:MULTISPECIES: LacI family DNA-binding transcriptional regulator [unclassified Paenibacillus]MBP1155810.1 LacI family transcriptional regulator [Paenibacillus sp. PvP091]MBP1168804.1 LacI family transcriptional regulator [Paenibacillus sp. PvR098]MBP2439832.1 LacI family transcriptional regulator [Paenibacillus sp. PvP052]